MAEVLAGKLREMRLLKEESAAVAGTVSEMVKSGAVSTDPESVASMRLLVQQMSDMQAKLEKMQEDIEGILGWIEGQNENIPIMAGDIETLEKAKISNYLQFQFIDSQENGNRDGYAMRRFRIGQSNQIDSRTSMKISFDVAAGSQRLGAELKDAILTYDIEPSVERVGTQLLAGQQPLPLGYELERSSSEREFPERALYNRTMFAGQRNRGVYIKQGFGPKGFFHAGMWNSLTVGDPQQTALNTYGNPGFQPAFSGGVRFYDVHYDIGVSGYFGRRQYWKGATKTAEKVDRRFVFVDANYVGLLSPNLSLRGELLVGRDRVPTISNNDPRYLHATDVLGWQTQLLYNIGYRNQVALRSEYFDPDTDTASDGTRGYGIAYLYYINPGVRLTFAYEVFDEEGTERLNNVWSARMQFKL